MNKGIDRARRELLAAQLLADNALPEAAVSRSYHAAFYAAEAALLVLRLRGRQDDELA